jgi:fructokinase
MDRNLVFTKKTKFFVNKSDFLLKNVSNEVEGESMFDLAAIGELLIDFTPSGINKQGITLFARNPGGAPANVLAMFSKLGGKTAFIGKVGKDDFGTFLKQTLKNAGINTTGLVFDLEIPTTLAFVHLNEKGDRSFSFYRKPGADLMLGSDEIKLDIIAAAKIFHFGAVSLTGEPCRSAVHKAVNSAQEQGKIISYDPNYRPWLWSNIDEAKQEMSRLIPSTDIIKVSEEELRIITGTKSIQKAAASLAEKGPAVVLVSLGAKGAYYFCADGSGLLPAYDVKTVDTTGAGDAFFGAILYRLQGKTREGLRKINRDELADMVDFGNAAGSLTTAKKGAIPAMPDKAGVEQCRKKARLLR